MRKKTIIFLLFCILIVVLVGTKIVSHRIKNKTERVVAKVNDESKDTNDKKAEMPLNFGNELSEKEVLILFYHSVEDGKNDGSMPPKKLDKQFLYLKKHGYNTLTMEEYYNYVKSNKPLPKKSVMLTFDDGYSNNYTNLFPLLKKYNFTATIYVATSHVDKNPAYLNSEQIKEMSDYGILIGSHTVTHPHLSKLSKEEQRNEMLESKDMLEKITGKPVEHFCYPYGDYNQDSIDSLRELGFKTAVTTVQGWTSPNLDNFFELRRSVVPQSFTDGDFQWRLNNKFRF
ncbi:polysaccharide deacetylase family protein [Clostridium fallax]|uniref:Polysaccharide deacetylase n=1 Tax=Clostridium fallax TaxID=1533 RepID=A0A1M4SV64_9CLOT|nr:polysaccharide deacetylase family protein [Clostridium fallax]SHE36090.1 Polysaccharide deacetylase [Clostridium fallax]SQB07988.1 putative xylanase/chitin deacetylase [Clostridium fallax]